MELEILRTQLSSQIQQHQLVIQQIKTDPQNPDLQKKLQSLQAHITSLSEQQSHVVKQLRQELLSKTEFKTEENNFKSPLSDNFSNITSNDYKEVCFPTSNPVVKLEPSRMDVQIKTEPLDVKPVKLLQPQKNATYPAPTTETKTATSGDSHVAAWQNGVHWSKRITSIYGASSVLFCSNS